MSVILIQISLCVYIGAFKKLSQQTMRRKSIFCYLSPCLTVYFALDPTEKLVSECSHRLCILRLHVQEASRSIQYIVSIMSNR